MKVRDVIKHEWKNRLSRPAALASLALFALALVYGAFNGATHRDARLRAIAAHESEVAQTMTKWRSDLILLEELGSQSRVPPWSGSAMDAIFASSLPPGPLSDFAIGQGDLLPHFGALSLWDPDTRLFSRYEFADPVALALGGFDLSKAVLLILPPLLIVLLFDVLSAERDANRLATMLVQRPRIQALFWWRLLIRSGMVATVLLAVSTAALLLNTTPSSLATRWPLFLLWLLAALSYAGFWITLIALVASRNGSGVSNALLLLMAWAGFALLLPAGVSAVAEAVYPTPSRLAYLAESRKIEIETELAEPQIAQRLVRDHPELFIDENSAIPAYVRTAFLVTSMVDKATGPVLADFERAASEREQALSRLRFISPAIVIHSFFNDIAEASAARHRRYVAQARAFKSEYARQAGGYILAGQRLPVEKAVSLADFQFMDEGLSAMIRRHVPALLALGLLTGLLALLAHRRLVRVGMLDE